MREEISSSCKNSKFSWPKSLVRKWFNFRGKAEDVPVDTTQGGRGGCRTSFSVREETTSRKKGRTERSSKRSTDRASRGWHDWNPAYVPDVQDYRIFTSTWNVGGKSPPKHLNLDDWLHCSPPADIYVLGFQEVVPLNAGNVLGTEDNGPAKKWVSLIRRTLNKNLGIVGYNSGYHMPSPVPDPVVESDADFEESLRRDHSFPVAAHRHSFQSLSSQSLRVDGDVVVFQHPRLDRRLSVCDPVVFGSRKSDFDFSSRWIGSPDEEIVDEDQLGSRSNYFSPMAFSSGAPTPMVENDSQFRNSRYCLVASKQMVGIFITVWVRGEIREDIKNIKISSVGRGLMGYLGNKGSISISMSLHQTSFCFVCCHLTSGEKEGDELRRNADVMEILRKTRFPRVRGEINSKSPETILDHDRIIWLGDLNYRIALSYFSAKALVEMHNWKQLLEKDQLRIQRRCGRVFQGWKEGKICFPPTYKYSFNSDRYAGDGMHPKEKRRTPAWCDRILWYGHGLHQLSYIRGESRFSDHRPVYSVFVAEVELIRRNRFRKNTSYFGNKIEIEELLPHQLFSRDIGLY